MHMSGMHISIHVLPIIRIHIQCIFPPFYLFKETLLSLFKKKKELLFYGGFKMTNKRHNTEQLLFFQCVSRQNNTSWYHAPSLEFHSISPQSRWRHFTHAHKAKVTHTPEITQRFRAPPASNHKLPPVITIHLSFVELVPLQKLMRAPTKETPGISLLNVLPITDYEYL